MLNWDDFQDGISKWASSIPSSDFLIRNSRSNSIDNVQLQWKLVDHSEGRMMGHGMYGCAHLELSNGPIPVHICSKDRVIDKYSSLEPNKGLMFRWGTQTRHKYTSAGIVNFYSQ